MSKEKDEKSREFREDRFTWKAGEVTFIPPNENQKIIEQECNQEKDDSKDE
ncbi:hypothetical protein [Neobacillus sp.]|uniref:hypothetical protein n=1 Tax=Neobacillus sp. TaxID=2675273 RepID=UPI00289D2E34|nr:hypothetical protein [Neobacillus sp.]